jgi:hypothetical protein
MSRNSPTPNAGPNNVDTTTNNMGLSTMVLYPANTVSRRTDTLSAKATRTDYPSTPHPFYTRAA